jgi:dynein heavy chain
VKEIFAFR